MTNKNNNADVGYSADALAQRKAELLTILSQAAPEVLSDNQQININKLKELLGEDRIASNEHYELSWAGKAAARREIQKTSSHTLLPSATNSTNAQHMLIEGENLEVLRVLQKSYYGKVKMIYIDPPYNTGNDSFVYPDDYSETLDEYQKRTGEKSEAGYLNKQSLWKKNSKESGQYHSAWLSMMYPRLYLARNLLREDGVIFISIDDNELNNLKILMDEVYGEDNFLGLITWIKKTKPINSGDARYQLQSKVEYVLCYSKYKKSGVYKFRLDSQGLREYKFMGKKGLCRIKDILDSDVGTKKRDTMKFEIFGITPPEGQRWKIGQDEVNQLIAKNCIEIVDGKVKVAVYPEDEPPEILKPFWSHLEDCGTAENGKNTLNEILNKKVGFDTVKPVDLVSSLILHSTDPNSESIVVDFFAGSGTTAHAVMELNLEDGGNRQCISVQMPELLDEDSEAYKAGYRTIADITRARIDKVIAKLRSEQPEKTTDLACAHFTLAPSNFKIWRSDVIDENKLREQLALFQSAEKDGKALREVDSQTAMLTELLLKHGLGALGVHAISEPKQIAGVTVHRVLMQDDRRLWLCFEPYTEALKEEIIKARPAQVILLNSCFVGEKADELLSNLQLELNGLDIGLTVI